MKKDRRSHAQSAQGQLSTPSFEHPGRRGHRTERLEQLLLRELNSLLGDEAGDPALEGIRLVSAKLSLDGGHARLAYLVWTSGDETQARQRTRPALERVTGFLRARLASRLDLKRVPKLGFTFLGVTSEEVEQTGGAEWLD